MKFLQLGYKHLLFKWTKSNIFVPVNFKISDMNKRGWLIPVLIVAANVLAIVIRWCSLPEEVLAHFDLQGNASGSIPRCALFLQPIIGVAVCLVTYIFARIKNRLQPGLIILASGICLVMLLSTMVSLTSGTMPIFMLAEPVVLLAAIVGFVICAVKSHKSANC